MSVACAAALRCGPVVPVGLLHCDHGAVPSQVGRRPSQLVSAPSVGNFRHDQLKLGPCRYPSRHQFPGHLRIWPPGSPIGAAGEPTTRSARSTSLTGPPGCEVSAPFETASPVPLALPLSADEGIQLGFIPGRVNPSSDHGQRERGHRFGPWMDRLLRGRRDHGHAVRHPLGRPRPRRVRAGPRGTDPLQQRSGLLHHRGRSQSAGRAPGLDVDLAGSAPRRGQRQGGGDPRSGLSDLPRRPRCRPHPGRARGAARRCGPGPYRPAGPPGPSRPSGSGGCRAHPGPARLLVPRPRPHHGHRRVVPRARRGCGGHRHSGPGGPSLRRSGALPPGAHPASRGDGHDPRPELVLGRAGRGLRRRRPLRLPTGCHTPTLHQRASAPRWPR